MNNHEPIVYQNFKGIWQPLTEDLFNDSDQSCPIDHQLQATNVDFELASLVSRARFGGAFPTKFTGGAPRRIHVIKNIAALDNQLLIGDDQGDLYLYSGAATTLLFSAASNVDYQFLPYLNRIYILPNISVGYFGTSAEPMLVYDGTTIRDAGGTAPATSANIANAGVGVVQAGTHFFGVSYETNTGFITPPTVTNPVSLVAPGNQQVAFTAIPVGGASIVARWIFATKAIANPIPGGTLASYQYFFVARIPDNVTTVYNANFYDSQLIQDMSYLSDIYANPPGGNSISFYHGRVIITAPVVGEIHSVLISNQNDPETFDQVTGVAIIDPTTTTTLSASLTTGLTGAQPYRDVLYLTKLNTTYSLTDNGQEPAFWPLATVDQTLGARPFAIVPVINKGAESVDYLIIGNTSGLYLFTGYYHRPEISWKIKVPLQSILGGGLTSTRMTIVNNFYRRKIYVCRENGTILYMCDYNEVNPDFSNFYKDVKWAQWSLGSLIQVCTLALTPNGADLDLLLGDVSSGEVLRLGSSADNTLNEDMDFSDITFPSYKNKDSKLIHVASIRPTLKASNSFNLPDMELNPSLYNLDLLGLTTNEFIDLQPINLSVNSAKIEPTIVTNFMAQSIGLLLRFTGYENTLSGDLSGGFILTKVVSFVKPIYKTLPFQYYE